MTYKELLEMLAEGNKRGSYGNNVYGGLQQFFSGNRVGYGQGVRQSNPDLNNGPTKNRPVTNSGIGDFMSNPKFHDIIQNSLDSLGMNIGDWRSSGIDLYTFLKENGASNTVLRQILGIASINRTRDPDHVYVDTSEIIDPSINWKEEYISLFPPRPPYPYPIKPIVGGPVPEPLPDLKEIYEQYLSELDKEVPTADQRPYWDRDNNWVAGTGMYEAQRGGPVIPGQRMIRNAREGVTQSMDRYRNQIKTGMGALNRNVNESVKPAQEEANFLRERARKELEKQKYQI